MRARTGNKTYGIKNNYEGTNTNPFIMKKGRTENTGTVVKKKKLRRGRRNLDVSIEDAGEYFKTPKTPENAQRRNHLL